MERAEPSFAQCLLSLALGISPFFLLTGLAAVFGSNTVSLGDQNVHGLTAMIVSVALNLVFATIIAGIQKLGFLILRLFRRRQAATS